MTDYLGSLSRIFPPTARPLFAASFDDRFYRAAYGEEVRGAESFEHFMTYGLGSGLKPNWRFDPLVFALHSGSLDLGEMLPPAGPDDVNSRLRAVMAGVGRPARDKSILPENLQAELDRADVGFSSNYARPGGTQIMVDRETRVLCSPEPEWLLGRMRKNRPFAFARMPQGYWDCLHMHGLLFPEVAMAARAIHPTQEHLLRLTSRMADCFFPTLGVFVENFLEEVKPSVANPPEDPNFLVSVSLKGYPTADGGIFRATRQNESHKKDKLRLLFASLPSGRPLYDATLWKRWLIAGPLVALPAIAREHPVVLVGAESLGSLHARWELRSFLHVKIPAANSYPIRQSVLEECKVAVTESIEMTKRHAGRRPIVVLQGGSFAYWLIDRLFRWSPDVFYIDFGQALNGWFLDRTDIEHGRWAALYRDIIVKNCDLGSMYRRVSARAGR